MQHEQDAPQALGQEAADDAKVWRQYVEEATEHDAHMLSEWSRNVDVSLIFAGLFSAVVATFAAQSYETLSANPQDATNALLASILAGQTAMNSGRPSNDVEARLPSFTPSAAAVWVNALWFTSLVGSLAVASVGMLVKQWLDAYSANLPASPRLRARVRQYRYDILRVWYTHHIINYLPFALSLCLILFLLGLVILLFDNCIPIGLASLLLFLLTVGFHAFSILLPALTNCPWKTAVSPLFYHYLAPLRLLPAGFPHIIRLASVLKGYLYLPLGLVRTIEIPIPLQFLWEIVLFVGEIVLSIWEFFVIVVEHYLHVRIDAAFSKGFKALAKVGHKTIFGIRSSVLSLGRTIFSLWSNSKSEAADEEIVITNMKDHLDSCAILWMVSTSTKKSVVDCALQSMAGLPVAFCDGGILHSEYLRGLLHRRLADCIHGRTVVRPNSAELYIRSLYRNRLSHETLNKVHLKTLDCDLLHNVPVDPASPLYITLICTKAMLNEILDCLANVQAKTATYAPYHIQLMVTSIAHEVSGRKGPSDDHWMGSPSGGWVHISSRALPILITLLEIPPAAQAPSPLDLSIAKCIVVLTNGTIDLGEASSNVFLEYVLCGLGAIIRFPGSYGCDTAEDISIIYRKYLIAFRRSNDPLSSGDALVKILRVFTHKHPDSWDLQDIEGLVTILAHSRAGALRTVDWHLVVYILQNITTLTSPPTTLIYQLLVCAERLVLECACTGAPGSALLVDSLAKLIYLSIRNFRLFSPIQSQTFRVLINIGHQYCIRRTSLQSTPFIKGLLDASREFFDNPSSIIQADVDLWVDTLVMLDAVDNVALKESRAVDAVLQWTIRNWRGHVAAAPHMERLRQLAESLGIKIDLSHDPTWFRELDVLDFIEKSSGVHYTGKVHNTVKDSTIWVVLKIDERTPTTTQDMVISHANEAHWQSFNKYAVKVKTLNVSLKYLDAYEILELFCNPFRTFMLPNLVTLNCECHPALIRLFAHPNIQSLTLHVQDTDLLQATFRYIMKEIPGLRKLVLDYKAELEEDSPSPCNIERILSYNLANLQALTSLTIPEEWLSTSVVTAIAKRPILGHLEIVKHEYNPQAFLCEVKTNIKGFAALDVLSIPNMHSLRVLSAFWTSPSRLKHLTVSNAPLIHTLPTSELIAKHYVNLESLRIIFTPDTNVYWYKHIALKYFMPIFQHCKKLKSIKLVFRICSIQIDKTELLNMAMALPLLEEFSVEYNEDPPTSPRPAVDALTLVRIARFLPNLKTLRLEFDFNFKGDIERFLRAATQVSFPKLTLLDLGQSPISESNEHDALALLSLLLPSTCAVGYSRYGPFWKSWNRVVKGKEGFRTLNSANFTYLLGRLTNELKLLEAQGSMASA
ncbi:hypothetical protein ONZ45_g8997 [Pleurotus djamor]|nr:hypothetical protein ONZ45_g8997 [Pleurotus djamor]